VKGGGQKGHGPSDKVKASPHTDELAKCEEECGIVITGDVAALQCDCCENPEAWKCAKCLGMSADLYQELMNNRDFKWFCRECHTRTTGASLDQNTSNDNMEKILVLLCNIHCVSKKGPNFERWLTKWLGGREQRVCINGSSLGWERVLSGVPQESAIGPILFLIYINDLDLGVDNDLLKFADDKKLYSVVTNTDEALSMQKDLNVLTQWTSHWQMKFNVPKCLVMHLGSSNIQFTYAINGQVLQQVDAQSDLGVTIRNDLKACDQCVKSYAKASRVLGMIGRNIRYKSPDVVLSL